MAWNWSVSCAGIRSPPRKFSTTCPIIAIFCRRFVWQDYDLAPRFPKLIKFLDFWRRHLEGPLASVRVAHKGIIGAHEMRYVGSEWRLH